MAINIVVPELGESVVEATVLHWLKQQGDAVQAGETLVELETEKVNLDVSAPAAGVLSRIAHPDGTDVKIGDVLGEIEPAKAGASPAPSVPPPAAQKRGSEGVRESAAQRDVSDDGKQAEPAASEIKPTPVAQNKGEAKESAAPRDGAGDGKQAEPAAQEIKATPVAQRLAQESGVDLRQVTPSAPDQRVTKQDVEAYLEKQKRQTTKDEGRTSDQPPISNLQSPPSDREKRVRMSRRRQTIARRLVEAQQTAAMLTTFNEVDMTAVMDIRKRHKESFKARHGISLGLTSFFVPAVIGALKAFPQVNAEIQGDEIVYKEHYDIGIAVGAEDGLVVPVLRDADRLSFPEIEKKIREFGEKAQNGTLALNDLRGGTFTITNGGVYGSLMSTPILNPPQVGILGLHKIQERPVAHEGQVVIRPMMYVALSYDHRLVDGREAVQFLVRVKELIEDPGALLLEG